MYINIYKWKQKKGIRKDLKGLLCTKSIMGSDLKVGDIMKRNVITVNEKENVITVAKLMKEHDIGSIVVTKDKKAEGIITERDIIRKVVIRNKEPANISAGEVMTSPIMVIKPNVSIEDAAKVLKSHKIKRLPVINDKKEVIGIITEGDIMSIFPAVIDLIEEKANLK